MAVRCRDPTAPKRILERVTLVRDNPILVIGGGIAGIAAAWHLARSGAAVTLLEARSRLGGRLTSHEPPGAPTACDNGPHLFLSAYTQTRRLLREWGAADDFDFPYPGSIAFAGRDGSAGKLTEWLLPSPFNWAAGLLRFPLLSWRARRRGVLAVRDLLNLPPEARASAAQWLEAHSAEEERAFFWHPLIRAALNAPADAAPLKDLQAVLRDGFCRAVVGGRPGYAKRPLGDIFGDRARSELEAAGVAVRLKSPAEGGVVEGGRLVSLRLRGGEIVPCAAVVAALPPWALADWLRGVPGGEIATAWRLPDWRANPIAAYYLWAEERPWAENYTCLPGRTASWVFDYARLWADRAAPLGIILETPEGVAIDVDNEELLTQTARTELADALPPMSRVRWTAHRLTVERRATPLRPRELWDAALPQTTGFPNLVLAGDWLDPDLPPTIEAAVRTGTRAAELLIK